MDDIKIALLKRELLNAVYSLDESHRINQPSLFKRSWNWLAYWGNPNRSLTRTYNLMSALYGIGNVLDEETISIEKDLNTLFTPKLNFKEKTFEKLKDKYDISDELGQRIRDFHSQLPPHDTKEKQKLLKEYLHELSQDLTKRIFRDLLNELDDSEKGNLNNILNDVKKRKEAEEFYQIFKVNFEDKDKSVFARLGNDSFVKFQIKDNQLIPLYIFGRNPDTGVLERTRIHLENKKRLLANQKITFIVDPNHRDSYKKDGNIPIIFFHLNDTYQRQGDKTTLNENGDYVQGVRAFKKVNHQLSQDANRKVKIGHHEFLKFFREELRSNPSELPSDSESADEKKPRRGRRRLTKRERDEKIQKENKQRLENEKIQEENKQRLNKKRREIAEAISEFTIGYRKKVKYAVHFFSWFFAFACGFATFNSIFVNVMSKNIISWMTGTGMSSSSHGILVGLLQGSAGFLLSPAFIGFSVIGTGYIFYAVFKAVQAYRAGQPVFTKDFVAKIAIGVLLISIPFIVFYAPPLVIAIYLGAIVFLSGVERNRYFTRKTSEETAFAMTGESPKEFLFKSLLQPKIIDQYGVTHSLTGKYLAIFIVGTFIVLVVSVLTAAIVAAPFITAAGPVLPILGLGITAMYTVSLFGLLSNSFKKVLFDIKTKGLKETLKSYVVGDEKAGESKLERVLTSVIYITLLLVLGPLVLIGLVALCSLGAQKFEDKYLVGFFSVAQSIAKPIATVLMAIAFLGRISLTALSVRNFIRQEGTRLKDGIKSCFTKKEEIKKPSPPLPERKSLVKDNSSVKKPATSTNSNDEIPESLANASALGNGTGNGFLNAGDALDNPTPININLPGGISFSYQGEGLPGGAQTDFFVIGAGAAGVSILTACVSSVPHGDDNPNKEARGKKIEKSPTIAKPDNHKDISKARFFQPAARVRETDIPRKPEKEEDVGAGIGDMDEPVKIVQI